jgi:hypothetical protein
MPNALTALQNGDKVFVVADFNVRHYGICKLEHWAEAPRFIHGVKGRHVTETDQVAFSGGRPIYVEYRASDWLEADRIVAEAESLIGTPYDFFNFNCEQAANYAAHGEPVSHQLRDAFGLLAVVGIFLFIASGGRR